MKQEKTIRIFISSTFKDMHSERDYLVRVVFPELRERCLKKGLHLVDVDLRWGVTEEEAERGKVLEICLDEIENCRPFFIGLLGERYGWVPDQYEVPDHSRYDWLNAFEPGHSVTAVEIYHGVLNSLSITPRSFFYFRDAAFMDDVPGSKLADLRAENPEAAQKLFKLKNDIRNAYLKNHLPEHVTEGYPCRYGGLRVNWAQVQAELRSALTERDMTSLEEVACDDNLVDRSEYDRLNERQRAAAEQLGTVCLDGLESFGDKVLQDLWKAIEDEYPETEEEENPLAIEETYHRVFLDQRTHMFIGQEDILSRVNEYLQDTVEKRPLVISGSPGCGKSALMAMAAKRWQQTHPEDAVVARFIGVSPSSLEIDRLIVNIIETISHRFGLPFSREELVNMEKISTAFRETLYAASRRGNLLIFIDAVNQMMPIFNAQSLNWLPKHLPDNVRFILSMLPGEALDVVGNVKLPVIEMTAMASKHSRSLVANALQEYRKGLGFDRQRNCDQMVLLLSKAEADRPLYLTVACEELRVSPRFEEITLRIQELPDTIPELFAKVLSRLEDDYGKRFVADTLALIACSRYGLLETELLELLKKDGEDRLPVNIWARLRRALKAYLRNAGANDEGLIGFFHQQLLNAVKQRYLPDDAARVHYCKRLADYGLLRYYRKNSDITNTVLYTGIYLYQAGDEGHLYDLLKDIFTLDDPLYETYVNLADTIFDWVAYELPFEEENVLKSISEKLAKEDSSHEFIGFLYRKGNRFQHTGVSMWALFTLNTMKHAREERVAHEPERTDCQRDLSVILNNIGNIYDTLGDTGKALEFFQKSLHLYEELVAHEPDQTEFRRDLSISFVNVGNIYKALGDGVKALEFSEKSLHVMEELVTREPDRTDFQHGLLLSLNNVGDIYSDIGDCGKALEISYKSLHIIEELVARHPDRADFRRELSIILNNVGNIYKAQGDGRKALESFKKSLHILEELVTQAPERTDFRRDLSVSFSVIGNIYSDMGDCRKAIEFCEKSLHIIQELVAREPARTDFQRGLFLGLNNIGVVYKALGDGGKALEFSEKALRVMEKLVAREPDRKDFRHDLSYSFNGVGKSYEALGDRRKALEFLEKSRHVMEELFAREPERTDFRRGIFVSFNNIGKIYSDMGDRGKALEFFEKSLHLSEELFTLEPDRTDFRVEYATGHWNMFAICSRKEDEIEWLTKAREIVRPLIEGRVNHAQLSELWLNINDELSKRQNVGNHSTLKKWLTLIINLFRRMFKI